MPIGRDGLFYPDFCLEDSPLEKHIRGRPEFTALMEAIGPGMILTEENIADIFVAAVGAAINMINESMPGFVLVPDGGTQGKEDSSG